MALTALSDANYAGDPDDRKSTGGYCIYLGSNWFLGAPRDSVVFLAQVQRPNTLNLPTQLLLYPGFVLCLLTCVNLCLLLNFGVIILAPFLLLLIPFSMLGRVMLRWTIIMFVNRLLLKPYMLVLWPHMIKLLMSSLRGCHCLVLLLDLQASSCSSPA